jgi:hypothetical protein
MTDPYTSAANAIAGIITAEFAPELIVPTHDKIHESLGTEGIEVGIEPMRWGRQARNANVKDTFLLVRFYDMWEKHIDPTQQVDPRRITAFADRFERRLESTQATVKGDNVTWYFEVTGVEFPDDPTGNKTRFVATIKAVGDNAALIQR